MALPPSFTNSFWTADFSLEPLLDKLQAGTVENEELLRFISDRATCSSETAKALYSIAEQNLNKRGFNKDEGASLRRTFEGLKHETGQTAKAHETVANNLDAMILRPFSTWANSHENRISELRSQLGEAVKDWQELSDEARRLKEQRNIKCSQAEEAEDDLRFAPTSPQASSSGMVRGRSDSATSASAANAVNMARDTATHAATQASLAASNLARTFSQRMRVSPTASAVKQRFDRMRLEAREKELAAKGREANNAILEQEELVDDEGQQMHGQEKANVVDKEKLRNLGALAPAAELQEKPMKIDELEIGSVTRHPKDWSIIFAKAKTQVPTTAVKVPLMGTTPDAHSGEDLVLWFRDNLDDLGGSLSRAHEFCRQLSEELAILKLVGEIGNKFFDSSDAFYAWRPEAFHLENVQKEINESIATKNANGEVNEEDDKLTQLPVPIREKRSSNSPLTSPRMGPQSPPSVPEKDNQLGKSPGTAATPPASTGGKLGRSNTFSSLVSSAYEKAASNVTSLNARMAKIGAGSDRLDRLKREADDAEEAYRVLIRELEDARMQLEELFAASLGRAQKLETDRLKAVKSVITTYNATIAGLNTPLQLSSERSALLGEAYLPSHDLSSVIERYRSGPFRPKPNVWTDFYHEETDVRYGIDLRHWRDTHDKAVKMPDLVEQLLTALHEGYPKRTDDEERRKTWVYEVPLAYTHRLRNSVNVSNSAINAVDVQRFDLPVIASALKLYLLELAVPLVPSNLYNDIKTIYPSVGADTVDQAARNANILAVLARVPKIHLVVLDELLQHLRTLISSTKTTETNADYITKLGHILGPCILRPPVESSKTLNDRFPALLFSDLIKNYDELLPRTMEAKNKVEEERYAPKRQRTKMIDQRPTRTSGAPAERGKDWLKQELEKRNGQKVTDEPEALETPAPLAKDAQDVILAAQASSQAVENSQVTTTSVEAIDPAENQAEKLEIPVPASEAGSISPGFVTPAEEVPPQSTDMAAGLSASTSKSVESAPSAAGEEEDLDKPLSSTVALSRSTDGSLPRRTNALSSSTKTRGPRPMSMQGPPASGGSNASGVRARAAMFEQRDGQNAPRGHRTTASVDTTVPSK